MAFSITSDSRQVISLGEYIQYVDNKVDLRDYDSIVDSAPMLSALSNDRRLVVNFFNESLKTEILKERPIYTAQSFILGHGEGFYVRGNIWKPLTTVERMRAMEERLYSYNLSHDHNFIFLTIGHFGPGYKTMIYEYERDALSGFPGETVELRFLEETTLPVGKMMLYREGVDVHTQLPPPELSISLNLMIMPESGLIKDQYFFDVEKSTLVGTPPDADYSKRASIIEMAGYTGDEETAALLTRLAYTHPCSHARMAAIRALDTQLGQTAAVAIEKLTLDGDARVRDLANAKMEAYRR